MKNILLTSIFFFLFIVNSFSQIINEVDAVVSGINKEFVEIKGTDFASLDGYVLILINGNNHNVYESYDLDGWSLDEDGFFTIGNNTAANYQSGIPDQDWLRDGIDAVALYQMASCPSSGTACESILGTLISSIIYTSGQQFDEDMQDCYGALYHNELAGGNGNSLQFDGISWYTSSPTIGAENSSSLPVELTSFELKVLDNNSVILFWQTASEENNSHFVIEHSRDGQRFSEVGKETGMGSTTIAHTYSMRHQRLPKGFHYYRLKQVDFDGKYEYSNIISAKLKLTLADVSVAPNPAMETVTIFIDTPISIAASYQLVNMQKEVMIEKTIAEGNSSFEIDMTNLPGGIYFMRFYVDQQVIAKKIVKLY